jgi:3-oxoadipate enol-lactonase
MPDAVARDGTRIRYYIDGSDGAPALLRSNSLGTTHELWSPQIDALKKRFRVIRYDTRGHGASRVPSDSYSLDDLGYDALAVLDAAGATRAAVTGLSLGGITAMWLGIHASDRVGAIVLANTAPNFAPPQKWVDRITMVRDGGMEGIADMVMRNWFTPAFAARCPDQVEKHRAALLACAPDGYIGCVCVLRDADVRPDLARIAAPTLVIGGSGDIATPVHYHEYLVQHIPGARLVTLDAGHLSNVEQPDDFSKAVLDWITPIF